MKIKKNIVLLLGILSLNSASALELMPEEELSLATGQDGVTIKVGLPTVAGWTAQSITLSDTTGIANTVKPGYDFHAGTLLARNVGMKTCSESAINGACTALAAPTIKLVFDVVGDIYGGGGNNPMLNVTLGLINGANKFRFYIDKLALRNGSGANEVAFIDFVHSDGVGDYVDIAPVGGGTLLTLQLGSESAGHMMNLTNANFGTIDFGQLVIRDKTDTVNGGACASCNLRFGFKLDNVNLTGTGFDLSDEGLMFTASSFVTPMDITFSNIAVGNTITGTNTATDMGTIGIKGLQVTNFSFTLAGKS